MFKIMLDVRWIFLDFYFMVKYSKFFAESHVQLGVYVQDYKNLIKLLCIYQRHRL